MINKSAFGILICLFYCSCSYSQTNYSPETLAKIKEVENSIYGNVIINDAPPSTIAERMAKYNVKGMSIAVIHNYKVDWAKGYGWADEEEKRPMTTETLFEPGSISKSLNAVAILKLAQEKKLDLNTDINNYLTTWKFPYDTVSHGKKITLAQILTHTAGLSTFGFPGRPINGAIPTVVQVLDGIPPAVTEPVRSIFEPGTQFQYSGGGTTISQLILTDVTHQKYEDWLYANVLKPIGMQHSSFEQPPSAAKRALCASGYYSDGSRVLEKFRVYPMKAAAGLWTTPSDLCNYMIDMQLAYQNKKKSAVLDDEMVKLHLTPYNGGQTAMGTFYDERDGAKYFLHDASNDGFCGLYVGSLDGGDGVAIFLNSQDGNLMIEVLNAVSKAYNWKNYYREPQRKAMPPTVVVPESTVNNYEGIYLYDQAWAGISKIGNEYLFHANGINVKMYFTSETRFYNEEFSAVKDMLKDEKGNITGYSRLVDGKEFPNARKVTNLDTLNLDTYLLQEIAWYHFMNKNYGMAVAYYERAKQLYPDDLNVQIYMAHAYLFNNEYQKALSIYKAHLKEFIRPGFTWENQLRDDKIYFLEHRIDTKQYEKALAELGI